MRSFTVLLAAALCVPATSLFAGSPTIPAPQDEIEQATDPGDAIDELISEYDEAMEEFKKLYEAAETDEERKELYGEHYPDAEVFGAQIWLLVEANPTNEAVPEAIHWMLDQGTVADHKEKCLAILIQHHLGAPELGDVCTMLAREAGPETERFLRAVRKKSTEHGIQGKATYALSGVLASRIGIREVLEDADEELRERYVGYYSEELVVLAMDMELEAVRAERVALLTLVRDKFGDVKTRRGTLGTQAGAQLFEMQRLQIGMVAPDIVGADLDGVEFKLSDYRGKVVFLDFWGDW